MNQEKIGKFILSIRQKNNLTQQEFANKLGVTSQAVSKWENGRGLPDIEMLKKISEEFNLDIDSIINAKLPKKSNSKFIYIISFFLIILIITVCAYFYFNHKETFEFGSLSTSDKSFNINGVVAFSKDKKSLYISKIEYLEAQKDNLFYGATCSLYEVMNGNENKISQIGSIENYDEEKLTPLADLLNNMEFRIDDYESICSCLTVNNLFIVIEALDQNKKIVTYKIPLTENNDEC